MLPRRGVGARLPRLTCSQCACACVRAPACLPALQEDVDKFIDGRSKILLGDEAPGSGSGEDGEDDVDVVGLGSAGDSDDDSSDDGGAGALLSDDGDDDAADQRGEDGSWWGKKKSDYYDADEAEGSDDEREEEAEARKLQQKRSAGLRAADFGDDEIESSDEDAADASADPSLGDALAGKDAAPKRAKTAGKTDAKASKRGAKGDKQVPAPSTVHPTTPQPAAMMRRNIMC